MTGPRPVRLAIYDLDRTITRLPTWTPFLLHAVRRRAPWRFVFVPVVVAAMLVYRAGGMSRRSLKQVMHRLLLGRLSPAAATALAREFAAGIDIYPEAGERIAADRAAGYHIVIATAAYRFYAQAIADRVGADALIATECASAADGTLLPRVAGDNCYGEAKRDRIAAWLASQGLDRAETHLRFYSDHASDAPTFDWVDEPYAVNPHARLRALAAARGWPVIDWRAR